MMQTSPAALDAALLAACPLLPVPRFGALPPMTTDGHRFLVAANGVFVEIRRSWLSAILRIGNLDMPLPYGSIEDESIRLCFGKAAFADAVHRFINEAAFACPQEHAAWLAVDDSRQFAYAPVTVLAASEGHIRYERPTPPSGQTLAIDCHSHGVAPAFFSRTDNIDDRNDDVKLSVVVGSLDTDAPSVVMRLSAFGQYRDLSEWAQAALARTVAAAE